MSYLLGESVAIHLELTVDAVDTDASSLTITIVKPDGSAVDVTPTPSTTGIYDESYVPDQAGRHTWVATAVGTIRAVAAGVFDVVDPLADTATLTGVQPWTDAAAVRQRPGCASVEQSLLDNAARAATDVLYALSGRQFSGRIVTTVRPTARRSTAFRPGGLWYPTWGVCSYAYASGYGAAALAGWLGHHCQCAPHEIELGGYPVTAILAVKIDGTTIPANEYRVDDYRLLVRVKPTADATPTARAGWPTCQRLDLPDTEPGTFSAQFAYGTPPPLAGVEAATALAAELALARDPGSSDSRLPQRVRSIVRQGESITLIDPQDVLDKGRTGIPEVDLFIKATNSAGLTRRSSVWSPDLGRARRTTLEST